MKVILLQDNKKLGRKGDIVNVSDGFAFNNLIPQGIAKAATAQALAEAAQMEKKIEEDLKKMKEQLQSDAKKIDKKKVTVHAQAKGDKLFGSVTGKEITEAIKEQHDMAIDEKMIDLDAPIKELTTREVTIDYGNGVRATVIVTIAGK